MRLTGANSTRPDWVTEDNIEEFQSEGALGGSKECCRVTDYVIVGDSRMETVGWVEREREKEVYRIDYCGSCE